MESESDMQKAQGKRKSTRKEQDMVCTTLMSVFFVAFLLCGCSLDTFFDGGAPLAILTVLVAIGCAMVLGGKHEGDV